MAQTVSPVSSPLLSILVPTVPNRVSNCFQIMIKGLERQSSIYPNGDVELIGLYDNKVMRLGAKRNKLLNLASGKYVVFVDDDDKVADNYILEIMRVIRSQRNPDVIHFPIISTIHGKNPKHCEYGLNLEYTDDGENWTGKPAHTHVWRREIATMAIFPPDLQFEEDIRWVEQVCRYAKTEHRIDSVLYYYNVDVRTETRPVVYV